MSKLDLLSQIALGEDSTRQFKVDVRNAESLASEMAAFANMSGGAIFIDDHDGCLFTTIIHRRPVEELDLIEGSAKTPVETTVGTVQRRESVGKASGKILEACQQKPAITIPELAELIGITERSVQRNIQKLQAERLLRRVGGRKEGHWEVLA